VKWKRGKSNYQMKELLPEDLFEVALQMAKDSYHSYGAGYIQVSVSKRLTEHPRIKRE